MRRCLLLLCVMEVRKSANHCQRRVYESLNRKHGKPVVRNFQIAKNYRNEKLFEPYNRERVFLFGDPLRHVLLSTLPGADEKDKLAVTGFERSKNIFYGWWGLPESAFECRPWPDGTDGEQLVQTDLSLLGLGTRQDEPMTNRERKRSLANTATSSLSQQLDWPGLPSEEWLQLDSQTKIALLRKAGHFGGEEKRHPEFCGIDVTRRRRNSGY
jgi:hypothetical protein